MKKKWIVWSIVAAVAVVLGIVFSRYILVGVVCAMAGWVGHILYTKHIAQ